MTSFSAGTHFLPFKLFCGVATVTQREFCRRFINIASDLYRSLFFKCLLVSIVPTANFIARRADKEPGNTSESDLKVGNSAVGSDVDISSLHAINFNSRLANLIT